MRCVSFTVQCFAKKGAMKKVSNKSLLHTVAAYHSHKAFSLITALHAINIHLLEFKDTDVNVSHAIIYAS